MFNLIADSGQFEARFYLRESLKLESVEFLDPLLFSFLHIPQIIYQQLCFGDWVLLQSPRLLLPLNRQLIILFHFLLSSFGRIIIIDDVADWGRRPIRLAEPVILRLLPRLLQDHMMRFPFLPKLFEFVILLQGLVVDRLFCDSVYFCEVDLGPRFGAAGVRLPRRRDDRDAIVLLALEFLPVNMSHFRQRDRARLGLADIVFLEKSITLRYQLIHFIYYIFI